jgi:hypothetical protein
MASHWIRLWFSDWSTLTAIDWIAGSRTLQASWGGGDVNRGINGVWEG